MKKPDLIVFDLDGTLIDSVKDLTTGINYMRNYFGLESIALEKVITFIGDGVKLLIKRAIADSDVDFDAALNCYRGYYAEHSTVYTDLYPGVAAGLAKLKKAGVKLAVVTNKPSGDAVEILRKLGAFEFFDGITGGDADIPLKPAPDALLAYKEQFNATECWMFGDHYTDLEAGRRAGFFSVFAKYGFGECRGEKPDMIVNSFAEITDAALCE